jgi:uncharacterized repeat protein (TIGR04076 family)
MDDDRTLRRRDFLTACAMAGTGLVGAGAAAAGQHPPAPAAQATRPVALPPRRRYRFEVEIVECKRGQCAQHQVGQKFEWPAEKGKLCSWLLDSMGGAVRVLEWGGTLPWLYEGTPYKKVIDPEGVTTEFIRCPDPTESGVVAKITRTRV